MLTVESPQSIHTLMFFRMDNTIKVGSLVETLYGSVGRVFDITPANARIELVASATHVTHSLSRLRLLSNDPPSEIAKPTELNLPARRKVLIDTLYRIWRDTHHDSIGRFLEYTRTAHWFWQTLACSISKPNRISYALAPEYVDNDKRRRSNTFGSFLRNVAPEHGLTLTDIREVDKLLTLGFADLYNYEFEIVSGNDIIEAYDNGPESCMAGASFNGISFLQWYADNPDRIRLLKILRNGEYIGRALIWKTDCGATVLDRIYPSDQGPHIAAAICYADDQGWDYRTNHHCADAITAHRKIYQCTLPANRHNLYPYIDSFKYTDAIKGPSVVLNTKGGTIIFASTNGDWSGFENVNLGPCIRCNVDVYTCDHRTINEDVYCRPCYSKVINGFDWCVKCGRMRRRNEMVDDSPLTMCIHCLNEIPEERRSFYGLPRDIRPQMVPAEYAACASGGCIWVPRAGA